MFLRILILSLLISACPAFSENTEADFTLMRNRMVEKQIIKRGITDSRIISAFRDVKRHLFVKEQYRNSAYMDTDLQIGEGQTISRPYIVAIMTYIVAPARDKKILEIGTGSGYHACILSLLVNNVYTIEIVPKLAAQAAKTIKKFKHNNIKIKVGDGHLGWKEHAPYDGIIVTGASSHIPAPLIEQLAVGGRMVIPISYSSQVQELLMIEKLPSGELKRTSLIPVRFVELIKR